MIKKHGDFFQLIELRAGLNENLMGLRGGAVLHFNNSAHVQTRRIDSILTSRHHGVADFNFLETRNVTHFDQRHTEIGASSHRTQRARLSELTDNGAGAGFLIGDQHHLRRPWADGDDAADDAAAGDDRHVDCDS